MFQIIISCSSFPRYEDNLSETRREKNDKTFKGDKDMQMTRLLTLEMCFHIKQVQKKNMQSTFLHKSAVTCIF